jgi:hypothetical protein
MKKCSNKLLIGSGDITNVLYSSIKLTGLSGITPKQKLALAA